MAQSKQSPQEFLRDSFTPQIGVLCSATAEQLCRKNNLSFIELLQPFCRLSTELHFKDPNGTVISLRNFKITLVDVHAKPPQTALARKFLNSSVSESTIPPSMKYAVGDYSMEIPNNAPWFEAWRETFFHVQYPGDHEFIKHLLACILVVSTSDPNPIESMEQLMTQLAQLQNTSISKLPKWFSTSILNYFVILHENISDENDTKAQEIYERMKVSYGSINCFLLKMNSRPMTTTGEQLPDPWSQFINPRMTVISTEEIRPSPEHSPSSTRSFLSNLEIGQEANEGQTESQTIPLVYHPLSPESEDTIMDISVGNDIFPNQTPVLHGGCLSTDDVEQIKHLVLEFATRGLMPHVERQIHQLSDYVANKKGVSKSLFSATKRWFTPNKPTSNSATINTLTYPADAAELQIRRLGDLYFMFGHYAMAYQAYHTAKRDFMADQAWLYCAGALEMASLAAFMANEPSRKSFDYMEESINTYLTTCKMPQFATKATLLSAECLRGQAMYGEAAHQLIRMANEDSDLRSALLLEQAAYCFLQCSRPNMVRKYAFHMVLAGHRFTKASQRRHSLRCYKQAYQIYESRGWNLAADHILSSIGRLAKNLNEFEEAMQSYAKLLTDESKQTAQQQEMYLKEYLTIHSELSKKQNNLLTPVLPLPLILNETIKVLVGPTAPLRTPGKMPAMGVSLTQHESEKLQQKWHKLEEMLVQEAQGSLPMLFKPMVTLFTGANIANTNPIAVIGEPIQVSVELYNPLQILLHLKDIYLLWHVKNDNNRFAVNEIMGQNVDHVMKTHYVKSVVIQANSKQEIILSITPLAIGDVFIKGICYSLIGANNSENEISLRGKQIFTIKPPKIKQKKEQDLQDSKIEIKIVPSAPCLQVSFCEMNAELLRNELQEVSVELRNIGSVPLHKIYMATSMPHLLSSCEFKKDPDDSDETAVTREKEARKNHVSYLPLPNGVLEPGQFYTVQIWLKAPELIGPASIDLLIYYENIDATCVPRYRLIRHVWHLSIQESIKVDASAMQSCDSRDVEQLALMVRATNLNKIHHAILTEIKLLTAALLSKNWVLSTEMKPPTNIKLESQASYYLFLKMRRKSVKAAIKGSNYSEVSFSDNPEDKSYSNSNSACLDFAKRNDRNRVNIFDSMDDRDDVISRKQDAMLVLRWRANVTDSTGRQRVVYGQNQIPIHVAPAHPPSTNVNSTPDDTLDTNQLSTSSASILFERAFTETMPLIESEILNHTDRQVTYNLLHPACISHDFNAKKLCVVPVKLLLHSIATTSLIIKVHTLGTSSDIAPSQHTSLFYPYSSSHFRWIKLGSASKTIEPLSSISLNLSVAVLGPGTYDLGSRIEIWCHHIDLPHTAVLQSCRVQSSLIITGRNSC